MLGLIWSAIIGLVAGALAKLVMPGKDPGGIWVTMVIGVGGGILATILGRVVGWYREGETGGFIAAFLGAVLLLWIYRLVKKPKSA